MKRPHVNVRLYSRTDLAAAFTPSASLKARRRLRASRIAVFTFLSLTCSSKKIITSQHGHCREYPLCTLCARSRKLDRHRVQWIEIESSMLHGATDIVKKHAEIDVRGGAFCGADFIGVKL
jgi:hypothetical protein